MKALTSLKMTSLLFSQMPQVQVSDIPDAGE